ncbi:hypothetical protein [Corynebacterium freneyi]|uniref:Secretion/DNA translocation related CpaE-like protein n=1 Tax=Corynebacterium freneyi TaxID=134034 RepID=A0ABS4UAY3_9CORY|nr:hypothetical protein [Corynebacterium freneyi]MBP2333712.1 secretion/DNA translocation related CpaE-like protein [Corynebacterium freneyi]QXA52289.1 hypothetical protein I6L56_09410 [Corynebacterium freneyi]
MDEQTTGPAGPEDVIIAVGDPELEQEAATIIAATGRRAVRVDAPDPSDAAWRRCAAILVDEGRAVGVLDVAEAGDGARVAREGLYLLHSDDADPPDEVARRLGCGGPVALPSCGVELVGWIGRPGVVGAGRVIACVPAVGGAGASTAAAVLAMAASRTSDALLVDADEFSGGADLLLGAEAEPGVRWPDVRAEAGALDAGALFGAVPSARVRGALGRAGAGFLHDDDGPGILTGPRSRADDGWSITPRAVSAVVDAVVGSGGTAVVDLPGAGAIAEVVAPRADVLAVIVPATVRGLAAAARHAAVLRGMGGDPVAVVRWPAPGGVTIDDVCFATGLDVIAEMPHLRAVPREIEVEGLGRSVVKLMRSLAPVLDAADGARAGDPGRGLR